MPEAGLPSALVESPLHLAARHGRSQVVRQLIGLGCDVDARDDRDHTPLHRATFYGHLDTAALLLDHGAHTEVRGARGNTPLHAAALRGQQSLALLLIERGADLDARNDLHETPLHSAVWTEQESMVDLLIDRGANLEAEDKEGRTPFHMAIQYDQCDAALILWASGALAPTEKRVSSSRKDVVTEMERILRLDRLQAAVETDRMALLKRALNAFERQLVPQDMKDRVDAAIGHADHHGKLQASAFLHAWRAFRVVSEIDRRTFDVRPIR